MTPEYANKVKLIQSERYTAKYDDTDGAIWSPSANELSDIYSHSSAYAENGLPIFPKAQWRDEVLAGKRFGTYEDNLSKVLARNENLRCVPYYFWHANYRFELRELPYCTAMAIKSAWQANGLELDGYSQAHTDLLNAYTFDGYAPNDH